MHPKTIHKTHDFQSLVYGEPQLFNNIKEKKGFRESLPLKLILDYTRDSPKWRAFKSPPCFFEDVFSKTPKG